VPIGTIMSRVARGRDAVRRQMLFHEVALEAVPSGRARHLRRVK
jgi:hypothetical protein